ncbi:MAG: tandem-95 repeat protein [Reinekea sp.]
MFRNTVTVVFIQFCIAFQAFGASTIVGEGSTFVMSYDDLYTAEYQAVMNNAAQFWADTVRSAVPITVYVGKTSKACGYVYNAHVSTAKPAAIMNFNNAPKANIYYPVALANSYAEQDLTPNEADIEIYFNSRLISSVSCQSWYLGYDANFSYTEFSLYFETMQEIAHGLGFEPLGDLFNAVPLNGTPDIFWTRLKSNRRDKWLTELPQADAVALARDSSDLVFAGNNTRRAAANIQKTATADGILLFSRTYDIPQLSGMHFHEHIAPLQLMAVSVRGAIPQTELTVAVLEDLGWKTTRNSAPVITGQQTLTVNEGTSFTLSVSDFMIEDEAPESLTLTIKSGRHYTVAGHTITPEANFNGSFTVPVTVSDGEYQSNTFNATVSIQPVNDTPVITGYVQLETNEDQSLTLTPSALLISDTDSSNFTLTVFAGDNYQVSKNKVIPNANFYGTLDVPVSVSDGNSESARYVVSISVIAVNDPPQITEHEDKTIQEDQELTLGLSDVTVSDVDSSQFTLKVMNGLFYQVSGNTITPQTNFSGTLEVSVVVNDGHSNSNSVLVNVTVQPVNDAPILASAPRLSVDEDSQLTLSSSQFSFSDVDSSAFSLMIDSGQHYSVSGNTIVPEADFFGTLSVPVQISDGQALSNRLTMNVTVIAINDAPVLSGVPLLTTLEDHSLTISTSLFDFDDIDSTEFSVVLGSGAHYRSENNTLIPEQDFFGSLSVPVQISDGVELSNHLTMIVNVTAENDAPVITDLPTQSIQEDGYLVLNNSMLALADPDSDEFTLNIASGEHYQVNGLKIVPEADWFGELTVPVTVNDGNADSEPMILKVAVLPANDAPKLNRTPNLSVAEDTALAINISQFETMDIDSEALTLVIHAGEHYQVNGQTFIPELNYYGTLSVPVQISDGVALSNLMTMQVTVTAVNDVPVITALPAQTIAEDGTLQLTDQFISIEDPDSDRFSVNIALGEHYQVAGTEILPDANWYGELSIAVTVNDGIDRSEPATLELIVEPVNDWPELITLTLPQGQIFHPLETALSASDVENDNLIFTLGEAPTWVSLTVDGELSAYTDGLNIGEHDVEILVSDGQTTVSNILPLTINDDPTATDLSVSYDTEHTIWSTRDWLPLTVTLNNDGPMDSVTATLDVNFSGDWNSPDSRCVIADNQCQLIVTGSETLALNVRHDIAESADLVLSVSHDGYDYQAANNHHRLTLTFTDNNPTTPQYAVPNFGQGHVRALVLANIQGGGWPEILFANGPTEASSAFRFEHSLFNPVLHSHLADTADSYGLSVFDIDGDGDHDWVLANGHGEPNTVYRNDGNGFFKLTGQLGNYDSRAVAHGDIDMDGDQDLIFANAHDPNTLYLNDGNGHFTLAQEFSSCRSYQVLVHDFNQDGRSDFLFAGRGFRHRMFLNHGFHRHSVADSASFKTDLTATDQTDIDEFDTIEFGDENDQTSNMQLADLDGDGIASDLIAITEASDGNPASLKIFTVADDGTVTLSSEIENGSVSDLSVGDYDGDGKDDVALLHPGGALELMQTQDGMLTTFKVMDTNGADTILLADVDGNGTADVISANNRSQASQLNFSGEVINADEADADSNDEAPLPLSQSDSTSTRPLFTFRSGTLGGWLSLWLLGLISIGRRRRI